MTSQLVIVTKESNDSIVDEEINQMKKNRAVIALLLIAFLLAMLSACNSKPTDEKRTYDQLDTGEYSAAHIGAQNEWLGTGGYYKITSMTKTEGTISILPLNDSLFYLVMNYENDNPYSLQDEAGKVIYLSDGMIFAATAAENRIWIAETVYSPNGSSSMLKLVSENGSVERTINLNALYKTDSYVKAVIIDSEILYVFYPKELVMLSESGELLDTIKLPTSFSSAALGSDGRVYVAQKTDGANEIFAVEDELVYQFSVSYGEIYAGGEAVFILAASDGLFAVDSNGGENTIVLWDECGISIGGMDQLVALPEGSFLALINEFLYKLEPAEYSGEVLKKKLTLAFFGTDYYLESKASKFNATDSSYYVEVVDYTNGGELSYEQAVTKMNTDMMTGNAPDMICFDELSPYSYIGNGYLVNMQNYLDTDEELTENDLVVSSPLKINGGYYVISNAFIFETMSALSSRFGSKDGWTLAEYLEIEKTLPSGTETLYNTTKDSFLRRVISCYLNTVIDWENGRCDFDNDEFIELLETSNRVNENPEDLNNMDFTYGPVRLSKGTLIAAATYGDSVWKLCFEEKMAGSELSFIGWPTADGSNGSFIYLSRPIGIVSIGQSPDECWEFIKFTLMDTSETYENKGILPIYRPLFEAACERAKSDKTIPVVFTDADEERLVDFLSSIENLAVYDEVIIEIISNEAKALFNGAKTANEVAKLIQSKVSIYIAEQS